MGKIDFSIGQPEPVPEEKTILVNVKGRHASAVYRDIITSGSRGIYASFTFDAVWDDLTKIAVFEGSERKIDVELTGESCEVPPEVMEMPTSYLRIGVYGVDGTGSIVIPTVYASVRRIEQGTDPSGEHPAEKTKTLVEKLMEAAQAARDAADEAERLAQSVRDDANAGKFGSNLWWCRQIPDNAVVQFSALNGKENAVPVLHDYVFGPETGTSGNPTTIYEISQIQTRRAKLNRLGSTKGEGGFAPVITIETITGGHRVTITSAAHPEGQSFDVMDGQGRGITVDDEISATSENPVQNKVIKAALDGKYSKPASGIPASDLEEGAIPTVPRKTSELQNDSGFVQAGELAEVAKTGNYNDLEGKPSVDESPTSGSDALVKSGGVAAAIASAVAGVTQIRFAVVQALPAVGADGTIYLVPNSGSGSNIYDEYIYVNGAYERLGTTEVDLTGYRKAADQDTIDQQQNAAIAAKYTKPGSGIPASDLASEVQTSLGKADTALQQHQDISGKADKVTEVTNTSTGDVTLQLDPGKIYHFTGAISSLTLTLATPASGQLAQYHFDFDSGSTAATISISGVTWPEGSFTPEASTHYEVDILNGYGLYIGWEVTP